MRQEDVVNLYLLKTEGFTLYKYMRQSQDVQEALHDWIDGFGVTHTRVFEVKTLGTASQMGPVVPIQVVLGANRLDSNGAFILNEDGDGVEKEWLAFDWVEVHPTPDGPADAAVDGTERSEQGGSIEGSES